MSTMRIRFRGVQTFVPGSAITRAKTTSVSAMCVLLPNATPHAHRDAATDGFAVNPQLCRHHEARVEIPDLKHDNSCSFETSVLLNDMRIHFEFEPTPTGNGVDFDAIEKGEPPDTSTSLGWLADLTKIVGNPSVSPSAIRAKRPLKAVRAQVLLTTGRLYVEPTDVSGHPYQITNHYKQKLANAVTWEVPGVSRVFMVLTPLHADDARSHRIKLEPFGSEDIHLTIANSCDVPQSATPQFQNDQQALFDHDFQYHYPLLIDVGDDERPVPKLLDSAAVAQQLRSGAETGITPWMCFGAITRTADLAELVRACEPETAETSV